LLKLETVTVGRASEEEVFMRKVMYWQDCLTQAQRDRLTSASASCLKAFLAAADQSDILRPIKLGARNGRTLWFYPKDEDPILSEGGLVEVSLLHTVGGVNSAHKVAASDDELRRLVRLYELLPWELMQLQSSLTADLSDKI